MKTSKKTLTMVASAAEKTVPENKGEGNNPNKPTPPTPSPPPAGTKAKKTHVTRSSMQKSSLPKAKQPPSQTLDTLFSRKEDEGNPKETMNTTRTGPMKRPVCSPIRKMTSDGKREEQTSSPAKKKMFDGNTTMDTNPNATPEAKEHNETTPATLQTLNKENIDEEISFEEDEPEIPEAPPLKSLMETPHKTDGKDIATVTPGPPQTTTTTPNDPDKHHQNYSNNPDSPTYNEEFPPIPADTSTHKDPNNDPAEWATVGKDRRAKVTTPPRTQKPTPAEPATTQPPPEKPMEIEPEAPKPGETGNPTPEAQAKQPNPDVAKGATVPDKPPATEAPLKPTPPDEAVPVEKPSADNPPPAKDPNKPSKVLVPVYENLQLELGLPGPITAHDYKDWSTSTTHTWLHSWWEFCSSTNLIVMTTP
jgi:hypothetical protein